MMHFNHLSRANYLGLHSFIPVILAAIASGTSAQPLPDAGAMLQLAKPPVRPIYLPKSTELISPQTETTALPPSAPILIQRIEITGNSLMATVRLQALVADALGQNLTLPQLGKLADRITADYQEKGFPFTRAIVPAQTIKDGVVMIQVIEARYGKVILNNQSQIKDSVVMRTLAALQPGRDIQQNTLERSLLLLSDFPGILVSTSIKSGEAVGTSDVQVDARGNPAVGGSVTADNYGSRSTGRERLSGAISVNNPLNQGDIFAASAMTSGHLLNYGRLAYESMIDGQGSRLGGAYSDLTYALGHSLVALEAHGNATSKSLWSKHALLRTQSANVSGQFQFEHLQLRDRIDTNLSRTDRQLKHWTGTLLGDIRDALVNGSVNSWSVAVTHGKLDFDNAAALQADTATAKTRGNFTKANVYLTHWQGIDSDNTVYLTYSGQWASTNLDASQKQAIGGPASVRAYDVGALSGDNVQLVSAEYRYEVGPLLEGQLQLVAFADAATIKVNQRVWSPSENQATLSGVGLGLNWTGPMQWAVKAHVATLQHQKSALLAAPTTRGWVELQKRF